MSLTILYFDELKGYYKSKMMIVLWIGMPLISILMHLILPDMEGISITQMVVILVSSIGGTISSVMLSTSITSERNRHVYDLFLIRPVKRHSIIISKYLAVMTCLLIATSLSLIMGIVIDITTTNIPNEIIFMDLTESVIIALSVMSVSCTMGILFGMMVKSVAVAAILAIYVGNQLSSILLLPLMIPNPTNEILYSIMVGVIATIVLLGISIIIFKKKQF